MNGRTNLVKPSPRLLVHSLVRPAAPLVPLAFQVARQPAFVSLPRLEPCQFALVLLARHGLEALGLLLHV